VLRSMGIRTQTHPGISGQYILGTPSCMVKVYLDGVQVRDLFDLPIDNLISPSLVHAVEVYRRASELPAEFGGSDARCGVAAIWTRRK
jgi:hypothetical protein